MLSVQENELLTQTGPGTVMGNLMRQYWIPALLSSELPEPDGRPLRLRLFSEELVAFRDTAGRVGVVALSCPHRGAPLSFARNEQGGLRCVYHGWKFDVAGACVEMPSEPEESSYRDKVRLLSYPCRERAGILWTYMGPRTEPPPLPNLEWNTLPDSHVMLTKRMQFCNWAQAIEGEIDQSHLSYLHSRIDQGTVMNRQVDRWRAADKHPRFFVHDADWGVMIGARRVAEPDTHYWRFTQYLLPSTTMVGPYGPDPFRQSRAFVPMDDKTAMVVAVIYHPTRPLSDAEIEEHRKGSGAGFVGEGNFLPTIPEPGGAWRPKSSSANEYGYDFELQRTRYYSGIGEFWAQDAAMIEGMGAIYDRSREHLGTSDSAVIRVRRRLLDLARRLDDDASFVPPGVLNPDVFQVRGAAAEIPREADWLESAKRITAVVPGLNPDAP